MPLAAPLELVRTRAQAAPGGAGGPPPRGVAAGLAAVPDAERAFGREGKKKGGKVKGVKGLGEGGGKGGQGKGGGGEGGMGEGKGPGTLAETAFRRA